MNIIISTIFIFLAMFFTFRMKYCFDAMEHWSRCVSVCRLIMFDNPDYFDHTFFSNYKTLRDCYSYSAMDDAVGNIHPLNIFKWKNSQVVKNPYLYFMVKETLKKNSINPNDKGHVFYQFEDRMNKRRKD